MAEALAASLTRDRKGARGTGALACVALDFLTWERLTGEGLSDRQAAALMADAVNGAARSAE